MLRETMSTSAPRSREIAAELRRQIESGELPPGARVPSTRAIVDQWGVAMATATKVLTELRHQGLVRAVPGVGTVVEGDRRTARAAPTPRRHGSADGALSAERIVTAGVAIADAEGLMAVSMRRIASELGVATMSLYRHVQDKDDLLLRMMDAVMEAETRPPADPPPGWRARVEVAARLYWEACRRHPWLASAMSITRPQPLGGGLPLAEFLLTALDELGLDHQTTFTAHITLVNYVRGTAQNVEMEAEAQAVTGVDNEEWLRAQEPTLRAVADPHAYPVFTRFISQEYDFSLDELFEFGLGRMLDGLAALAAAAGGRAVS